MKAVIYARVSSTDESQSYERQKDDLKRWALFLRLEVVEEFAEKISAYSKGLDERIAFNDMLEFIEKKEIKHILVSEISRISRRSIDAINFINDCTKKGIAIHFHKESLSTIDEHGNENTIVQMMTGFFSGIAQQESISLSHRIKSGKIFSARNGGGFNQKIYGYDKGIDGKPIINVEQAVLIRKMFEMLLEGVGVRTISNYLNANFETKNWTSASVHSIVRNSFYCGKRKYKELIIEVPAIINEETFNKAQNFINERKRFVGRVGANVNPFASFIKCKCGSTMNQIINVAHNTDLYRCAGKCGVKSINRPFLIREIKQTVEKNAQLTKDESVRNRLKQNIETNKTSIIVNQNEIRSLKLMSDKNYQRFLLGKLDESKFEFFERKFEDKISKLNIDIKILQESNIAIKSSLNGKLLHYSDDLSVFKSQLLKSIEYIEIDHHIAKVKIKGWAISIIVLHRGADLFMYNRYLEKHKHTIGFTKYDWSTLPESQFKIEEISE